jgi:hypothetical protein
MLNIAPALTSLLSAVAQSKSASPLADPAFVTAREHLENVLARLGADTGSAFADGWPLAVMYRVATASGKVATEPLIQMDISINGKSQSGKSQSQHTGEVEKTKSGAA